jgi:hypothetical protein
MNRALSLTYWRAAIAIKRNQRRKLYVNLLVAADNFSRIHHIPIFWGFNGVGHEGTFSSELNGGECAQIATAWFSWQLKGDSSAGRMFEGADCGGLCTNTQWTIQKKLMD